MGDPLEIALLHAGRLADMQRDDLLAAQPEGREEAFDRDVKMMATFHEDEAGWRVAVKGAPEAVIAACHRLGQPDNGREFGPEERRLWHDHSADLAAEGLRVLAVATKRADHKEAAPYENLNFLGLIAMADPPRRDVPEAVAACGRAGIDVVMVTGDHPATAGKVAALTGIADQDAPQVIAGRDLKEAQELAEEERRTYLQNRVFARVSPEQKLNLIRLHQADGGRGGHDRGRRQRRPGAQKG